MQWRSSTERSAGSSPIQENVRPPDASAVWGFLAPAGARLSQGSPERELVCSGGIQSRGAVEEDLEGNEHFTTRFRLSADREAPLPDMMPSVTSM